MKIKTLVNSVKNNASQGVYDQEEILLLCDKVISLCHLADEVVQKYTPRNKIADLSPKDMKESMEARNRAWYDDEV